MDSYYRYVDFTFKSLSTYLNNKYRGNVNGGHKAKACRIKRVYIYTMCWLLGADCWCPSVKWLFIPYLILIINKIQRSICLSNSIYIKYHNIVTLFVLGKILPPPEAYRKKSKSRRRRKLNVKNRRLSRFNSH